jgi:protein arginine kinase activator
MKCQACGANPATVHLTQVMDGKVREIHLCESCAEQGGVNLQNSLSLSELLLKIGMPEEGAAAPDGVERSCPGCHMRRSDFKKTSRLGCAECYTAFAADLAPLIASMHKGERHVGKRPPGGGASPAGVPAIPAPAPPPASPVAPVGPTPEQLQKQLAEAIATENYEEAARLRDQIRLLEEVLARLPAKDPLP